MPKTPLNRDRAWACVTLNISFPGWGSIRAGKTVTGVGEFCLALSGLFLLLAWIGIWIVRITQSSLDEPLWPVPSVWLWKFGVICIVISWVWTAKTCFSLMREAKANEKNLPPRLSDLPKPPFL